MASKRNSAEDFNIVAQFAKWAEMTEEEFENFTKAIMTRRGHKPVTGWRESDEGNSNDKEPDNVFGINFGEKKASGQNWQYGS